MDAIKRLKKDVKKATKDEFEIGTVIRFTSGGKYVYAVIKTAIGWISTARFDNGFVKKDLTYDEVVEILSRTDVTDVAVATRWEGIADEGSPVQVCQCSNEERAVERSLAEHYALRHPGVPFGC